MSDRALLNLLNIFADFLLSFPPLSKQDTNKFIVFSISFWVDIQWLKTDSLT